MAILLKYRPVVGLGDLGAICSASRGDWDGCGRSCDPARTRFAAVTRAAALPRAETGGSSPSWPRSGLPFAILVNAVGRGRCRRCRRAAGGEKRAIREASRDGPAGGPRSDPGAGGIAAAARGGAPGAMGPALAGVVPLISSTPTMSGTAIYVYGLVGATSRPGVRRPPAGLPGGSRRCYTEVTPTLWLAAAEVPLDPTGSAALERGLKDMQWVADAAVAHEAVVKHFAALARRHRDSDEAVHASSPARPGRWGRCGGGARRLASLFAKLQGCEEWGVRIMRGPAVRPGGAPATRNGNRVPGRAQTGSRPGARSRAAIAHAADDAYACWRRSRPITGGGSRRPAALIPPLLDAAFLVPVRRRARFRAVADALRRTSSSVVVG